MAVYEVEAPAPAEVLTEREQRARTLEAAALEIEMRGWTKARNENAAGNVCLVGAIAHAMGLTPISLGDMSYHNAYRTWFGGDGSPFPGIGGLLRLPSWNDHVAQSAEEVTFFLRWRAEEIRDGWDA